MNSLEIEVAAYPRGRVPREVRRRHVVGLASELFTERGYDRASMDELAKRAGVSKPVVYDLVGSKEELFRDVMTLEADELARRISSAVALESVPEERLRAGAVAFFRFVGERKEAWASLMAMEAAAVTREVARVRRYHSKVVAGLLSQGAAELGTEADPLVTDAVAHAINGACEALATWWQEHPDVEAEVLAGMLTELVRPGLLALSGGRP
jgi:AcrR family transcriptional regulator